ncbi:hypothetical protein [Pseudomonas sp. N040]|uniref:hypothetical protein n=1 Tax=Pseudomonas sp. N040 TaxID=2785325 RepID=UPI0018A338CA|nr:hypothetical protein [Pseudomonas sp. N040]MBF7729383.1 hypothetical protein [Pseudomonas sp. N040]MBW7013023.1 hypothetical protein [Pseudomonas sp. N040]
MHLPPVFLRLAPALCAALLLSACANHLPQRSEHEARAERKLLDHSLQIDAAADKPLELPQRRISIYEQQTFEVTDFEVTRIYDRYTPYQAWREVYEIPAGAVAVVAGVGANVVNVVALGNVPQAATRGWIEYGMAGLNPIMNVQSNGRAEQNLASLKEEQTGQHKEQISLPWKEKQVLVNAGTRSHELTTDRKGYLYLNLLDGTLAEQDLSRVDQLVVIAEDPLDGTRQEVTLTISKALRGKLKEAHALIFSNLENDDVSQWVYRVNRLSQLGFEDEASELEQSLIELTRNDPELQDEFLQALKKDAGRLAADPGAQP